ncbi:hypothetical protein ACFE04_023473 [Oxalis oulophora]
MEGESVPRRTKLRNMIRDIIIDEIFHEDNNIETKSTDRHVFKKKQIGVDSFIECPISGQIMTDPVILANGKTYDRNSIKKWFSEGHNTCPQTKEILLHTNVTPNLLAFDIINSRHLAEHDDNIQLTEPAAGKIIHDNVRKPAEKITHHDSIGVISDPKQERLVALLGKLSPKDLLSFTNKMPSICPHLVKSQELINRLISVVPADKVYENTKLQDRLITTLMNLSFHEDNKSLAENPLVIHILIESLFTGSYISKTNAAATLFTLAAVDSNNLALDDAAKIFYLSFMRKLEKCDVEKLIDEKGISFMLLTILSKVFAQPKSIKEMVKLGALAFLFNIYRTVDPGREKETKNLVTTLWTLCLIHDIKCSKDENSTISVFAEDEVLTETLIDYLRAECPSPSTIFKEEVYDEEDALFVY